MAQDQARVAALKAGHDPARVAALVVAINQKFELALELQGKMPRGVDGAWKVRHANTDSKAVLKWVSGGDTTSQMRAAKVCAEHVNSSSTPTPSVTLVGYLDGIGTFYLQEFLPGLPSPWPSHKLIVQLVELNERQQNAGLKKGRNHNDLLRRTLDEDAQGWQKHIMTLWPEGCDFVMRVKQLSGCRPFAPLASRFEDIVHGDYQHYNALVSEDDLLTGYVDWDSAGFGDCGIDLARLLYDCYVAKVELDYPPKPETIRLLQQRIVELSGRAALYAYMSYWCLQVVDFGVKLGRADAMKFIKVGHQIVTDLTN